MLGDKPLVAETPAELLDDATTPFGKFFVRNNGQIPDEAKEPNKWKIAIDGEVNKPLKITLGELKSKYKPQTHALRAGMRRQWPLRLQSAGARQSMDQWRRRLRGMDRRASRRCAQNRGREIVAASTRRIMPPICISPAMRPSRPCRAACASRRRWTRTP